ncbi:MAG: hypothetical protein GC136_01130 [Alphaproteobacteria bacterium]|nr:hypothetical protein [Alphaproteobacteria bacterium]
MADLDEPTFEKSTSSPMNVGKSAHVRAALNIDFDSFTQQERANHIKILLGHLIRHEKILERSVNEYLTSIDSIEDLEAAIYDQSIVGSLVNDYPGAQDAFEKTRKPLNPNHTNYAVLDDTQQALKNKLATFYRIPILLNESQLMERLINSGASPASPKDALADETESAIQIAPQAPNSGKISLLKGGPLSWQFGSPELQGLLNPADIDQLSIDSGANLLQAHADPAIQSYVEDPIPHLAYTYNPKASDGKLGMAALGEIASAATVLSGGNLNPLDLKPIIDTPVAHTDILKAYQQAKMQIGEYIVANHPDRALAESVREKGAEIQALLLAYAELTGEKTPKAQQDILFSIKPLSVEAIENEVNARLEARDENLPSALDAKAEAARELINTSKTPSYAASIGLILTAVEPSLNALKNENLIRQANDRQKLLDSLLDLEPAEIEALGIDPLKPFALPNIIHADGPDGRPKRDPQELIDAQMALLEKYASYQKQMAVKIDNALINAVMPMEENKAQLVVEAKRAFIKEFLAGTPMGPEVKMPVRFSFGPFVRPGTEANDTPEYIEDVWILKRHENDQDVAGTIIAAPVLMVANPNENDPDLIALAQQINIITKASGKPFPTITQYIVDNPHLVRIKQPRGVLLAAISTILDGDEGAALDEFLQREIPDAESYKYEIDIEYFNRTKIIRLVYDEYSEALGKNYREVYKEFRHDNPEGPGRIRDEQNLRLELQKARATNAEPELIRAMAETLSYLEHKNDISKELDVRIAQRNARLTDAQASFDAREKELLDILGIEQDTYDPERAALLLREARRAHTFNKEAALASNPNVISALEDKAQIDALLKTEKDKRDKALEEINQTLDMDGGEEANEAATQQFIKARAECEKLLIRQKKAEEAVGFAIAVAQDEHEREWYTGRERGLDNGKPVPGLPLLQELRNIPLQRESLANKIAQDIQKLKVEAASYLEEGLSEIKNRFSLSNNLEAEAALEKAAIAETAFADENAGRLSNIRLDERGQVFASKAEAEEVETTSSGKRGSRDTRKFKLTEVFFGGWQAALQDLENGNIEDPDGTLRSFLDVESDRYSKLSQRIKETNAEHEAIQAIKAARAEVQAEARDEATATKEPTFGISELQRSDDNVYTAKVAFETAKSLMEIPEVAELHRPYDGKLSEAKLSQLEQREEVVGGVPAEDSVIVQALMEAAADYKEQLGGIELSAADIREALAHMPVGEVFDAGRFFALVEKNIERRQEVRIAEETSAALSNLFNNSPSYLDTMGEPTIWLGDGNYDNQNFEAHPDKKFMYAQVSARVSEVKGKFNFGASGSGIITGRALIERAAYERHMDQIVLGRNVNRLIDKYQMAIANFEQKKTLAKSPPRLPSGDDLARKGERGLGGTGTTRGAFKTGVSARADNVDVQTTPAGLVVTPRFKPTNEPVKRL